ncbi:MAG: hypothetical protein IT427_07305 [Pirellulales bacterium]|nr:hypothetical protein [Pirellulales bacterium]
MKRLFLAAVAVVAIGMAASSAQAGGWGHHHGCGPHGHGGYGRAYYNYYRPPVFYYPYAYPGGAIYSQPYSAYWPQNSFYYRGSNFGMGFRW